MGGIRTTPKGESVNIKGLFSAGEAACWDMHGFNRLGGNSVSETVVAGMIVGDYFADACKNTEVLIDTLEIKQELQKQEDYFDKLLSMDGDEDIFDIKDEMRNIMQENVGIFRNAKDLEDAVKELSKLLERSRNISIQTKSKLNSPELEEAYRVPMMIKVALCVAKGARDRTESRGAHYREDFLKRDDKNWLNKTITFWENEDDLEPTIKYEPLDIMKMEMIIDEKDVDQVTSAIVEAARTGKIGDGKIFVSEIDQIIRIRTGETDIEAI